MGDFLVNGVSHLLPITGLVGHAGLNAGSMQGANLMFWKKYPSYFSNRINARRGLGSSVFSGLIMLILLLQLTLNPFSYFAPSTKTGPLPGTGSGAMADKQATANQDYANLPLSFEAAPAQPDGQPQFLARGKGYTLGLSATEAVLSLSRPQISSTNQTKTALPDLKALAATKPTPGATAQPPAIVRMKLDGANPAPQLIGQQEQAPKSNYYLGQDAAKWRTNVANYGQVLYKEVYPGADLIYYGNSQSELEYDFNLAPGADPSSIKMNFEGVERLETNLKGELVLHLAGGDIIQKAPVIYQESGGVKTSVAGRYLLLSGNRVSFEIGRYDKTLPLVIDPSISYSTYLGGDHNDSGQGIAVDSTGAAYIVGLTGEAGDSAGPNSFPVLNAYDPSYNGGVDIFISKFNTNGTLAYSTFLGGSGFDEAFSIAVDSTGAAYIAGYNSGGDFPMMGASYKTTNSGRIDTIIGKLNPSGSLVYSTYLGGTAADIGQEIAVDSAEAIYVVGSTTSQDFPVVSAFQSNYHGDPNAQFPPLDGFVTKFNSSGSIVYSTFLGGALDDAAGSIAVDSGGAAYILGQTYSADFPLYSPAQPLNHGNGDAFVMKFDSGGSPVYSTFLGGNQIDSGTRIALNSLDEAIIVGITQSSDFPLFSPFQNNFQGTSDGFVTRLSSTGAFVYSTYLGGLSGSAIYDVAVDSNDAFYVVGSSAAGFPNFYSFQPTLNYSNTFISNGFITRFDSNNSVSYSSYYGWPGTGILGVAVQADGTAYITGYGPPPPNYFSMYNPFQSQFGGDLDAFVAKIKSPIFVLTPTQAAVQTALTQAAATGGEVIVTTFVSTLTLTSNLQIPAGVSLVGNCGPNGPDLELDGPGTVILQGNSQLIGVKLKGITLTNNGGNNLVRCVVVDNTP